MFTIRDLVIKITSQAGGAAGGFALGQCTQCTAWTGDTCDMGTVCPCSEYSYCTPCTDDGTCMCSPVCTGLGSGPAPQGAGHNFRGGLSQLKAALQRQLAAVEAQERARDAALRPKTVAEVDMLEAKLRDALDELADIRRQLRSGEES